MIILTDPATPTLNGLVPNGLSVLVSWDSMDCASQVASALSTPISIANFTITLINVDKGKYYFNNIVQYVMTLLLLQKNCSN